MLSEDSNKCYVVVGAFRLEGNASRFEDFLASRNVPSKHQLNTFRDLYYVYTYASEDREAAKNKLFHVREEHPYLATSWLYAGNFQGPHISSDDWQNAHNTVIQHTDVEPERVKEEIAELSPSPVALKEEKKPVSLPEKVEGEASDSYQLYFNALNITNHKEVPGKINVFDAERSKLLMSVNTHELTRLNELQNGTNRIKIESDIFGFRKVSETIDLDEVGAEGEEIVQVIGDTVLFNLEMLRYNRGDIIPMWQVYFYRDAAIMKQESVEELNNLFNMMEENKNMKIRIHGHTNGSSHGKVFHLDLDDKRFFSLNGSLEETNASAKKLSLYRAYTIQHWLIDQGIAEERTDIKGWGGKKMIYDKHDPQAKKNVRVEIEILEE